MNVSIKFKPPGGIKAHIAKTRSAAPSVAVMVGHQLHLDAVFETPRPPMDRSVLKGSGKVERAGAGARVSFNTSYALRLHETSEKDAAGWPSKKIDPGSGPKYLESKTIMFADKYNRLAAEEMARRTM